MRRALVWILAIAVGIVVVLIVTAAIGNRDDRDETVPPEEWAQSVCGAIGAWRGEMEAIVDDIRNPNASSTAGGEEPQSETPQGRSGLFRKGLERAEQATDTLVKGVENAGVPDTERGDEVADAVNSWANSTLDNIQEAQDSLDEEADSLEGAVTQVTDAAQSLGQALVDGVETLIEVVGIDQDVRRAIASSSTCRQLQEETS
jgi:hypothetical protein